MTALENRKSGQKRPLAICGERDVDLTPKGNSVVIAGCRWAFDPPRQLAWPWTMVSGCLVVFIKESQSMKVAVFGKPGGGKSTLALQIATASNLPLQQLDLLQFEKGGVKVQDEEFLRRHADALARQQWVADGFGTPQAFEAMLRAADVLVYVERSTLTHYWWVTKRLLKSPFIQPLGWPVGSPMLKSTLSSYRFLRLSSRFWTPALKEKLLALRPGKRVYVVRRQSDVSALLIALGQPRQNSDA